MSKGRILKLAANRDTRAWMDTIHRIAGRSFIASQDVCFPGRTRNRPAVRTQVRGAGETDWWTPTRSVRPSSRVDVGRAEAPEGLLVDKGGTQRCWFVNAKKLWVTVAPKFTVRSEGPAPYRMLTVAKHEQHTGGQSPLCARSDLTTRIGEKEKRILVIRMGTIVLPWRQR